jgi:hypothetical protein
MSTIDVVVSYELASAKPAELQVRMTSGHVEFNIPGISVSAMAGQNAFMLSGEVKTVTTLLDGYGLCIVGNKVERKPAPKCECGSAKVGSPMHSSWCPVGVKQ